MRSSKVGTYDSTFYLQRTLSDYENFEDVARSVGSADPQNDWENIAVRNLINEEDYSAEQGGPMFKISFAPTANFSIQTVVDHLIGERILGKDIDKNFILTTMMSRLLSMVMLLNKQLTPLLVH